MISKFLIQPLPERLDIKEVSLESVPASPSSPQDPVCVMDRLNKAIADGNHKEAAQLAKEVSKSQISAQLNAGASARKQSKSEKIRSGSRAD